MATKKSTARKPRKYVAYIKQHRLLTVFAVVLFISFSVFGYQKYLDARNVSDMKQLLSAFEDLKEKIESETDQDVDIEANCGSVGKFATSYACTLSLVSKTNNWTVDISDALKGSQKSQQIINYCSLLSEVSIGVSLNEDKYICSIGVRSANEDKSESIFYQYDTSPGRPF